MCARGPRQSSPLGNGAVVMKIEFLRTKRMPSDSYECVSLSAYDATEEIRNKTGDYQPILLRCITQPIVYTVCCHCGRPNPQTIHRSHISTPFRCCSSRCASFVIKRHKAHARRVTTPTHFITTLELYEKDSGICGICSLPVEISNASIDHIIPVSKGGTHTWDNVQLAHYKCNIIKSNNEMDKLKGQERFIQGAFIHSLKEEEFEKETEVDSECL
jgi:5-methylcytosine-specific restriction endonuclease McrA